MVQRYEKRTLVENLVVPNVHRTSTWYCEDEDEEGDEGEDGPAASDMVTSSPSSASARVSTRSSALSHTTFLADGSRYRQT